jgi:hypothetical protein
MVTVPVGVAVAADRAELRLLGSPFIRLRINCVAAENCGTYMGRVETGEADFAVEGAMPGVGLGVASGPGAPPLVATPGASAPAVGVGFDVDIVVVSRRSWTSLAR